MLVEAETVEKWQDGAVSHICTVEEYYSHK